MTEATTALGKKRILGTCSILGALINEVKAQAGKSVVLTSAVPLIADAKSLKTALGC